MSAAVSFCAIPVAVGSLPGQRCRSSDDQPLFAKGSLRAQRDGRAEEVLNSLQLINIAAGENNAAVEGDLFFNLNGRDYYARYFCRQLFVDPIN
jgi:hypothetical protein